MRHPTCHAAAARAYRALFCSVSVDGVIFVHAYSTYTKKGLWVHTVYKYKVKYKVVILPEAMFCAGTSTSSISRS